MDDKLIRFYTELIFVSHPPEKADVILVPGSDTEALGQKAAQLWKEGFAPIILVSGKYSITEKGFTAHARRKWQRNGLASRIQTDLSTVMN